MQQTCELTFELPLFHFAFGPLAHAHMLLWLLPGFIFLIIWLIALGSLMALGSAVLDDDGE